MQLYRVPVLMMGTSRLKSPICSLRSVSSQSPMVTTLLGCRADDCRAQLQDVQTELEDKCEQGKAANAQLKGVQSELASTTRQLKKGRKSKQTFRDAKLGSEYQQVKSAGWQLEAVQAKLANMGKHL